MLPMTPGKSTRKSPFLGRRPLGGAVTSPAGLLSQGSPRLARLQLQVQSLWAPELWVLQAATPAEGQLGDSGDPELGLCPRGDRDAGSLLPWFFSHGKWPGAGTTHLFTLRPFSLTRGLGAHRRGRPLRSSCHLCKGVWGGSAKPFLQTTPSFENGCGKNWAKEFLLWHSGLRIQLVSVEVLV